MGRDVKDLCFCFSKFYKFLFVSCEFSVFHNCMNVVSFEFTVTYVQVAYTSYIVVLEMTV